MQRYDVVVMGGSISGLTLASELARRNVSVCVIEEHKEIGEPESCDGLVSFNILRRYGYQPESSVIQQRIRQGRIHSPSGYSFDFSTEKMDLYVLSRKMYDKQVGITASSRGAEIKLNERVISFKQEEEGVRIVTDKDTYFSSVAADAMGPHTAYKRGLIPAAKYELRADWVTDNEFNVYLNQVLYPSFFAWSISFGEKKAKIGVAGRGINPAPSLEEMLSGKEYEIIRRVVFPIYVGGPRYPFVSGRIVKVGESAGQVKPTTAGGIALSVASSVICARWVHDFLKLKKVSALHNYEQDWKNRFGSEMNLMLRARKFFETLSNKQLDMLVSFISSSGIDKKIQDLDFDFHASTLLKKLGLTGFLKLFILYLFSLL